MLYSILSCKCPVTEETEKILFSLYDSVREQTAFDYQAVRGIADNNPQRTPFHNLFDFCTWAKDDPFSFTVSCNDVLRFLGSSFHYGMVASNNPGAENTNPELLVSHLLVPVSLKNQGKKAGAVYTGRNTEIVFGPLVVPADIAPDAPFHAHHMGVIVSELTAGQKKMLDSHQELIPDFPLVLRSAGDVDFESFPPYGNHHLQIRERFKENGLP